MKPVYELPRLRGAPHYLRQRSELHWLRSCTPPSAPASGSCRAPADMLEPAVLALAYSAKAGKDCRRKAICSAPSTWRW